MTPSVFQYYPVDDLSAGDAPPAEEFFGEAKKLFVDHHALTTITSHLILPF